MTTKTTGAEFKRFYNDSTLWVNDTYHEDEVVTVNGGGAPDYDLIPDDAIVTIEGGIICGDQFDGNEPSFETYFKRWKKKQTTITLVVECHLDKVEDVKAAVKAVGGKVQ